MQAEPDPRMRPRRSLGPNLGHWTQVWPVLRSSARGRETDPAAAGYVPVSQAEAACHWLMGQRASCCSRRTSHEPTRIETVHVDAFGTSLIAAASVQLGA